MRIDCGADGPFWPHVVRLTAVLPAPAAGGFGKGGHGGACWRELAPDEVEFIARALTG